MDYYNVPTTVFTPIEYGAIGYSEEDALSKFGEENIEVSESSARERHRFGRVDFPQRVRSAGMVDLPTPRAGEEHVLLQVDRREGHGKPSNASARCRSSCALQERVIGFHVLAPNAGEITQGYALGMRLGATKNDFNMTVGIHPTCAEVNDRYALASKL